MDSGKACSKREHFQYNSQDLDQEQNVHTNPVQLNTQNVQIFITGDVEDYSAVITGNAYIGNNNEAAKGVSILLYFGYEGTIPVYRTKSDSNGNFIIDNLPPGFYTIAAHNGEYHSQKKYVKILPGQTVNETILL